MSKLQALIKNSWGVLVWLFEQADIIPALVIISAWHYYGAMAAKGDPAPVAIALGVLTDIGHYRSIKGVARKPDELKRWAVGLVLTVLTGYYHYLWYKDIILALCVPALIISLALLSKWDGWDTQAIRMTPKRSADKSEAYAEAPQALPYGCDKCGERFATGSEKANHTRWKHPKVEAK